MATARVIAFDGGNHYTGVAIGDISNGTLTIRFVDVITIKDKSLTPIYKEYFKSTIDEYLTDNTLVIYENLRFNKNRRLQTVNTCIRKYFTSKQVKVGTLEPRQKWGVTARKDTDRKKESIASTRALLELQQDDTWLTKFNSYPRKHDIADTILMLEYLNQHANVLNQKMGRK
jgi:RNase H-fold protein (predicted Holliday junction resolvase)